MRTGQRYIHKAAFCKTHTSGQLAANVRSWKEEVSEVAEVTFIRLEETSTYVELQAVGKWK